MKEKYSFYSSSINRIAQMSPKDMKPGDLIVKGPQRTKVHRLSGFMEGDLAIILERDDSDEFDLPKLIVYHLRIGRTFLTYSEKWRFPKDEEILQFNTGKWRQTVAELSERAE